MVCISDETINWNIHFSKYQESASERNNSDPIPIPKMIPKYTDCKTKSQFQYNLTLRIRIIDDLTNEWF